MEVGKGLEDGTVLERVVGIPKRYGVVVGRVTYRPFFEKRENNGGNKDEVFQYMIKRLWYTTRPDGSDVFVRLDDKPYEIWSCLRVCRFQNAKRMEHLLKSDDPNHKEPKSKLAMYGYTAIDGKISQGKRRMILEAFCRDFSPQEAYDIINGNKDRCLLQRRGSTKFKRAIEKWEPDLDWLLLNYPETKKSEPVRIGPSVVTDF